MSKETTHKQRLHQLKDWMPLIIETVKKDLKAEHLKKDFVFIKKYLNGKNIHKAENQELTEAYIRAIDELDNGDQIAEFIANRWIFRNSDMYHLFEQFLSAINPNFSEITALTDAQANELIKRSSEDFGYPNTYIFALLNEVAFTPHQFEKLDEMSKKAKKEADKIAKIEKETLSQEALHRSHEEEVARLKDKYEKKLLGLQKKYTTDVEMLKKQVANLQRKLAGV